MKSRFSSLNQVTNEPTQVLPDWTKSSDLDLEIHCLFVLGFQANSVG